MIRHISITLPSHKRGFHLITNDVINAIENMPDQGLLHIFINHTSAGLTINENADSDVRHDFELFFNDIVDDHLPGMLHTIEGVDDMPAHIKSTLTGSSVSIPIVDGRLGLGTWQGIFLCEFRNNPRPRHLTITIIS